MWPGEGLGASRDNLSTNLARLKNLRVRFTRVHVERDSVLAEIQESGKGMLAEIQESGEGGVEPDDIALGEAPSYPLDQGPSWTHGIDLHWLAEEEREWLRNEHHTTLEMMFIYLVGVLDAFFGQWGVERKLWPDGTWPAATPENFREKAGLTIRRAAAEQLVEYRARRNVLVHRAGIADSGYCRRVNDNTNPRPAPPRRRVLPRQGGRLRRPPSRRGGCREIRRTASPRATRLVVPHRAGLREGGVALACREGERAPGALGMAALGADSRPPDGERRKGASRLSDWGASGAMNAETMDDRLV